MSEKRKSNSMKNSIVIGTSIDVVQRYGSAIKAHFVSYHGIDHEHGNILKRSLKGVSQSKLNPDYKSQNISQQAGFSAEIKETANINAERAIKGIKSRKVRTDDLGRTNDQIFDHVDIDSNGNIIPGSGSQMKFVGKNSDELVKKLLSSKYHKYLENDAKISIPSDLYDEALNKIQDEIPKIENQLEILKKQGKMDDYKKLEIKYDNIKKLKKNLCVWQVKNTSFGNEKCNSQYNLIIS